METQCIKESWILLLPPQPISILEGLCELNLKGSVREKWKGVIGLMR